MSLYQPEEYKVIDGVTYKRTPTGYSIRDYFYHPGPGWDYRFLLEDLGLNMFATYEELPDDPYYTYEPL